MLNKNRIKEAEANVNQYLREGLLKKKKQKTAQKTYFENCELSLETTKRLLAMEDAAYKPYLWVIVVSYYAMYYIANAVLLEIGYKFGTRISHKVAAESLIVFVRNRLKGELIEGYEEASEEALGLISSRVDALIESFDFERAKRSKFQYRMDEKLKRSKALTSFNRAKSFVFEMKKLLP